MFAMWHVARLVYAVCVVCLCVACVVCDVLCAQTEWACGLSDLPKGRDSEAMLSGRFTYLTPIHSHILAFQKPEFTWYRSSSPHIGVNRFRAHLMTTMTSKT